MIIMSYCIFVLLQAAQNKVYPEEVSNLLFSNDLTGFPSLVPLDGRVHGVAKPNWLIR